MPAKKTKPAAPKTSTAKAKPAKAGPKPKADPKAKETPKPKATKAAPAAPETPAKKPSALDAAHAVLVREAKPRNTKDLVAAMTEAGLWTSPGGKTPHATLYAAILREIATKGTGSRFRKASKGHFEAAA